MRLGPQPGEVIDRRTRITFTWNGRRYPAYPGDTIASALAAAGQRVLSRSLKYHRPRGLLTADHHDPGGLVEVDGEPNVRAAHRLVQAGMVVRAQNAWPSLRFDAKAATQLVGRFLTAGFYYKTFIKPQRLWPAYEGVLRRFSPGGNVPDSAVPPPRYDQRYAHPDVLVAGGGPAGMAAAVAAAQAGARVLLVDEQHELGGHLRWGGRDELAALSELRTAVAASEIEVMTDAVVTGRYDHNWLAVLQRSVPHVAERLVKARAKQLIVAPGLIERPYVFEGNDLPGVLLSTAVRRLVNLYAVKPGRRAVVLTANAEGDAAVADLRRAGVKIVRVLDARRGADIVRVRGHGGVQAVDCADGSSVDCDLLVTAIGWSAPTALLSMAGARARYHEPAARFVPGELPDDVMASGGVVGDGSLSELLRHALAVGGEAARRATHPSQRRVPIPELRLAPHPALFRASTHGFVDFCEDVSSKELVAAVAEGYDSIELAKRYTTATMGHTQGKLEAVNAIAVVAEATGRSIAETGTTTGRPPYVPVSLGALAGRRHQPVRRSPMQSWHERRGATLL
ncbi:MAG: Sarcosine oxidase, partial [Pseudonocardia sp.]|nr:Sarcosine oxidase [Pseudonocardia sp.]